MRLKGRFIRLLIGCCLVGFAFNAQAQSKDSGSGTNEWKRYTLGQGNFNVLFPAPPKEEFKSAPPSLEVPLDLYIYSAAADEVSCLVQYGILGAVAEKWGESAKESFYEGVWRGATAALDKRMEESNLSVRTKLEEKREIKFSGYAGREVIFTLGAFRGHIWMTVVGRQVFTAIVLGTDKKTDEAQQRFLNSFTITPKPISVEQTMTTK